MPFKVKPIRLAKNPFNPIAHRREINRALNESAERIQEDFYKTVKTWKNKPSFEVEGKKARFTREIYAENDVYFFLNGGTRVRYATMTGDFRAKTAPNRFIARGGRGGVAFINKKKPRKGIKARKFDQKEVRRASKWLPDEFKIEVK